MSIFEQVLAFIDAPEAERFEALALSVFRYQATHVSVYRAYLTQLGINPHAVSSLDAIPPVSTLAFKYARVENELHPESSASRVFLTSGTSIGHEQRGRHLVPEPDIYRVSAIRHLRRMLFPDGNRMSILSLHPTTERMPESSLSQMISWCIDEFSDGLNLCAASRESVNRAEAIEFLEKTHALKRPVCILGTTASCAVLFTAMREGNIRMQLEPGSRLMDTGGAKGQVIPLSPEKVASEAQELLGISPEFVINEYGMTEMCSQLYDATPFNSEDALPPGVRLKIAPPWLRPIALDPITLRPVVAGQPGILAFFDLANVGSISALMTEDIGIVTGDRVMILGRAAAADARGCALAIQQFAEIANPPSPAPSPRPEKHAAPAREGTYTYPAEKASAAAPTVTDLQSAAARLRRTLTTTPSISPIRTADVLRELALAVSNSTSWRRTVQLIAASAGYSEALLKVSLQALVHPLADAAEFARKLKPRRELLGFIMPGNVPGAGLHELITALAAGCAAIVKTSSAEPIFFNELAAQLRELDGKFGTDFAARLQVFNWERGRGDLTRALCENCDRVVAMGENTTIVDLRRFLDDEQLFAFGSRFSGAIVMRQAVGEMLMAHTADKLALDCAMFEQRGCLSPHHIFVEMHAREFTAEIAAAFTRLEPLTTSNGRLRRLDLQTAAAIRRTREIARWRGLGGADIQLWEDPDFNWTVIYDGDASFTSSPGFCTLYVSPFNGTRDLERRLEPVRGRLEAFAIATGESTTSTKLTSPGKTEPQTLDLIRDILQCNGATYICAPGEMQSPPLGWPHGGGTFIRSFIR
ncbi:MAG TPA: acyl-CoA reductase [Candidatus Binataceae bacterium]|nr:acyl-CoA reductase [Candidatus Binataceae bacterium]